MKKSQIIKLIVLALVIISVLALVLFITTQCNHEWDGGVLINATECGEGAIVRFTCLHCGITQEVSAAVHNYVPENSVAPTCTSMGYTKYECSLCKAEFVTDFVNACGHDYNEDVAVKDTTCTTSGIYDKICVNCGDAYRYFQNATGHSYVLVSDKDTVSTYECEHCLNMITVNDGEEIEEFVHNNELFDVAPTFTFDIVSTEKEKFIRDNLIILDNYYNNSEYEDDQSILKEYTLTYKENDVWTVSVISNYEYDTTYIAKLQNGISFADYNGSQLTFTITEDPNHENVYEYKDGIVFIQSLENSNPGYYPYTVASSNESEYLYLTLNKIDGLEKNMIICVGEVTSAEQITNDTECYFGRIEDFYLLPDESWMIALSEPEITEIFDKLDISFNEKINFEDEDIDIEQVKEEVISSLFENEDFVKFLSIVNISANQYYADNGYYAVEFANVQSFMEKVKIEPVVSFEDFTLIAKVNGSLNLPIRNSAKKEIGSFNVSFTVGVTSEFEFDVAYEIVEHKVEKAEINKFDIRITQTDTFDFNFNVSIDIYESLEEHPYVQNTDTGKIHRTGCVHLSNVTNTSNYKGISAETAAQYIKDNPHLGCNHCQPVTGFKSQLVVLNTKNKTIHAYGCANLTSIADENKKLSKENATYWMNQGYSCCQLCHPDSREELAYEAIYMQKLYCSDWQEVATDISQWAKDSGIAGKNKKGVDLVKVDIPIYGPVTVSFEVRFVLTLDIEATCEYVYSYQQVNAYGIRMQGGDMQPYSEKISSQEIENHCAVTGEVEVRAGLLVDANINIAGFSKWVRAGVTAEVGAYARIAGILCWSGTADEDYMAAYFEVGIYLDVNAYYEILWWDGEVPIYDNKWPLLTMGYERAYYGYKTYYDELVINGSYDIAKKDLLAVKYFDLKTMTTKTDELSLRENWRYYVDITFADGSYCEIFNGVIVPTSDAPEQFTDTMIITVQSDTDWNNFSKGSYVYYLGYYEIDIVFNVDDELSRTLAYELNGDGKSYSVTGIGTCTDKNVVIPSTYEGLPVTNIGDYAFHNCTSLESITIPDSVTSIGEFAFYYCASLESITIPDSVTSIGGALFLDCYSLRQVKLGKGITEIKSSSDYWGMFEGCSSLISVNIPNSVTSIGNYAFSGCTSLTSITIPSSVTSFGENVFIGCDSLTSVSYSGGVPSYNYSQIPNLTTVVIPQGTTHIPDNAFTDCTSLESVTIPNSVTSIGEYAFSGCTSLESITIPNSVTSVGEAAFSGCTSLESITIPNSVTSIGGALFVNCFSLQEVKLGTGITEIKSADMVGMFENCMYLTSISIPKSVTRIGAWAFGSCASLTNIEFSGTTEQWIAIDKGSDWNANIPATEIVCSNGTVTLE